MPHAFSSSGCVVAPAFKRKCYRLAEIHSRNHRINPLVAVPGHPRFSWHGARKILPSVERPGRYGWSDKRGATILESCGAAVGRPHGAVTESARLGHPAPEALAGGPWDRRCGLA